MEQEFKEMPFIIFLDIDGVLNYDTFFRNNVKNDRSDRREFEKSMICPERIEWLSNLCKETNSKIVVSSSWRTGKTIEQLQDLFNYCGGTFEVIGKTDRLDYERGVEINKWIRDNITLEQYGDKYYEYNRYVILDDDSDMLLKQKDHFFQTDPYSGLTPNICYRITNFFKKIK